MSRISRYQDSISKFFKKNGCCFANIIKDNKVFENIINTTDHLIPIILLTVLSSQYKKNNFKPHHGYYMASGIDILVVIVNIYDNKNYYIEKFGQTEIDNFLAEMPCYVFKCLSQNIETFENLIDKEKVLKIYHQALLHLQSKICKLSHKISVKTSTLVKKTDIIKFNFTDKQIIKNKYKKLKQVDKDVLLEYIDQKYGYVCQCAFVMGWLLGLSDEKMIPSLDKLGTHLGLIIKISNDFNNLEKDINCAKEYSLNIIANYGIHECFAMFMESKMKLIQGCLTLDIFTITVKEIIDNVEKQFDNCLQNTDIELKSMYSSFTGDTCQTDTKNNCKILDK